MDKNVSSDCPCKNVNCKRHNNCEACQAYHHGKGGKPVCGK